MLVRVRDPEILGLSRASQERHSSREYVRSVPPAQPPTCQPGVLLSKDTDSTYRLSESMHSVLGSCVRPCRSSAHYRVDRRKVDDGAALRHPPTRPIAPSQSITITNDESRVHTGSLALASSSAGSGA